ALPRRLQAQLEPGEQLADIVVELARQVPALLFLYRHEAVRESRESPEGPLQIGKEPRPLQRGGGRAGEGADDLDVLGAERPAGTVCDQQGAGERAPAG